MKMWHQPVVQEQVHGDGRQRTTVQQPHLRLKLAASINWKDLWSDMMLLVFNLTPSGSWCVWPALLELSVLSIALFFALYSTVRRSSRAQSLSRSESRPGVLSGGESPSLIFFNWFLEERMNLSQVQSFNDYEMKNVRLKLLYETKGCFDCLKKYLPYIRYFLNKKSVPIVLRCNWFKKDIYISDASRTSPQLLQLGQNIIDLLGCTWRKWNGLPDQF